MHAATEHPIFDLAIVGGGINGCGIARDAAGRGASVYLCEMNDLASGTSSWSTKLIHGGLRYLEHYEFRLVREALIEREVLWRMAPHIVHPLRFVLPYHKGLRPAWMLRVGLFLYDHLGARKLLPGTATLDLAHSPMGAPLRRDAFSRGFEYSDCRVDDARLVVLNAQDAAARGAVIAPRTRASAAKAEGGLWHITVAGAARGGDARTIRARALVNAGGPWVAAVLSGVAGLEPRARVRLVQGTHIVVPRIFDHDRAYIFQNADGRIVFAIPYEDDFTLIGTTDRDYEGDPALAHATSEEIAYLCAAASEYFTRTVTPADVVWAYAGVRPLYDDGASQAQAATREYVFELDTPTPGLPLLSIFGGKITTYRRLAEEALEKLRPFVAPLANPAWTAHAPLPGGDFPVEGLPALERALCARYSFLPPALARRLARTYGTLAETVLGAASRMEHLGRQFGAGLTEAETDYLVRNEWARTAEDVLWRRTKLGLHLHGQGAAALEAHLAQSVR